MMDDGDQHFTSYNVDVVSIVHFVEIKPQPKNLQSIK